MGTRHNVFFRNLRHTEGRKTTLKEIDLGHTRSGKIDLAIDMTSETSDPITTMSDLRSDVSFEEMSDLGFDVSRDGRGPFSKKG